MEEENQKSKETAVIPYSQSALMEKFAEEFSVETWQFVEIAKKSLFGKDADQAGMPQLAYLLMFCREFGFSPLSGGIKAFLTGGGAVSPLVMTTAWAEYARRQPDYKTFKFDEFNDPETGDLIWVQYTLVDKDKFEYPMPPMYMKEWKRDTEQWRDRPRHMLHIKGFNHMVRRHYGIQALEEGDKVQEISEVSGLRQELEVKVDAGGEIEMSKHRKAMAEELGASITALSPDEYEDHADNSERGKPPEDEEPPTESPEEGGQEESGETKPPEEDKDKLAEGEDPGISESLEEPVERVTKPAEPPETRKAENRRRRQPRDTKEDPGEETKPGEQAELEMSDDDQILIQEGVTALTKWRGNPMIAAKLKNNPAYTESANAIDTILKNSNALTAKETAKYIKVLLDGFAKIEGGQVAMVAQNEIITNCNMLTKVLVSLGVDFGDLMPK